MDVYRLKPKTRIGLYRAADNMPGGWLKWVFEQYGFHYREVSATEVRGDLSSFYDTIVLPDGMSRQAIVNGLDPQRYDKEWAWAYGVGEGRMETARRLGAWRRHAHRDWIVG